MIPFCQQVINIERETTCLKTKEILSLHEGTKGVGCFQKNPSFQIYALIADGLFSRQEIRPLPLHLSKGPAKIACAILLPCRDRGELYESVDEHG